MFFFNSVLRLIFSIFRNNSYTSPFNSSTEGTLLKCLFHTAHNARHSKDVDALKFQLVRHETSKWVHHLKTLMLQLQRNLDIQKNQLMCHQIQNKKLRSNICAVGAMSPIPLHPNYNFWQLLHWIQRTTKPRVVEKTYNLWWYIHLSNMLIKYDFYIAAFH